MRAARSRWLGSVRHALRPPAPPPLLRPALAMLDADSLAIDCGANVGDVTRLLARTGARVIAIEPNPVAFARLQRRASRWRRVECVEAAASTKDGFAPLFLHELADRDPLGASTGSSLLPEKRNVDPNSAIRVRTIDLDAFIAAHAPVAVLKMDVEGAEVDILERLLETGRLHDVGLALVEMHDWHTEELSRRGARIRRRLAEESLEHVCLDWH